MSTPSMEDLILRYKQVQSTENTKDGLIHDLFAKLNEPQPGVVELRQEFQKTLNSQLQLRDLQIATELDQMSHITSLINRESLVNVIIDGDGTVFSDHYLQRGQDGGREAGSTLWTSITVHCGEVLPVLNNTKIVARIYANVKLLTEKCLKAGIISSPGVIDEFIRGFNDSSPSFDFVDIGTRANAAYEKVVDNFNTASLNCHTRLIILGGSHDDSYADLLEDVQLDTLHRVSLLEAIPCSPAFSSTAHLIGRANFPELFRSTPLPDMLPTPPRHDFDRAPGAGVIRRPSAISDSSPKTPNTATTASTQTTQATQATQSSVATTATGMTVKAAGSSGANGQAGKGSLQQKPSQQQQQRQQQQQQQRIASTTSSTSSQLPQQQQKSRQQNQQQSSPTTSRVATWASKASANAAIPFKDLTKDYASVTITPATTAAAAAAAAATAPATIPTTAPSASRVVTGPNVPGPNGGPLAASATAIATATGPTLTNAHLGPGMTPLVQRNKRGQRVDNVDFKNLPKLEIHRLKQMKLCNSHYLLGECANPSCVHVHDRKIASYERRLLHLIARMTPCRYGPTCDDATCIYGHRCPYSTPGVDDCRWKNECRFPKSAHGVDLNVVRTTTI